MKKIIVYLSLLGIISCTTSNKMPLTSLSSLQAKNPKNVILLIVDGMGFSYLEALKIYQGNKALLVDEFLCKTHVTTCSLNGSDADGRCIKDTTNVTDSAASATAIATGSKVENKVISIKNNKNLKTILEKYQDLNKSTGIVATKLMSDATPAAFASHAYDRKDTQTIVNSMFNQVMPTLVLAADTDLHKDYATKSSANYKMIANLTQLNSLVKDLETKPCNGKNCPNIYGGFAQHSFIPNVIDTKVGLPLEITPKSYFESHDLPHLSDMAFAALSILKQNQQGFFLMLESSMPDMVGHYNKIIDTTPKSPPAIAVLIREMIELEKTIKVMTEFVKNNPDTLLIITADHETGGLVIDSEASSCIGQEYCLPSVKWTSKLESKKDGLIAEHTNVDVPLFATGLGAEKFCQEYINNTDIIKLILNE